MPQCLIPDTLVNFHLTDSMCALKAKCLSSDTPTYLVCFCLYLVTIYSEVQFFCGAFPLQLN